jgi:hypothetical protein
MSKPKCLSDVFAFLHHTLLPQQTNYLIRKALIRFAQGGKKPRIGLGYLP